MPKVIEPAKTICERCGTAFIVIGKSVSKGDKQK